MKTLNQYIQEKLIINKDYNDAGISPKSFDELRKIIDDRYDKLGPGTEHNPIDFNDIRIPGILTIKIDDSKVNIDELDEFLDGVLEILKDKNSKVLALGYTIDKKGNFVLGGLLRVIECI